VVVVAGGEDRGRYISEKVTACNSKYAGGVTEARAVKLQPLDAVEEPAWRDLARFFVVAPRLLDEDLQRGANMSLSTYSTLTHLSEAPDQTLRITELANRAYLSGSRTTRLVDELAADGLVIKRRCTKDARGVEVILTAKGLQSLQHAYPVHLRSVRSRVLDHIPRSTLPDVAEAMRAIAEALG
jgi:DNA-binding MarR family transcriptional regulator